MLVRSRGYFVTSTETALAADEALYKRLVQIVRGMRPSVSTNKLTPVLRLDGKAITAMLDRAEREGILGPPEGPQRQRKVLA